MDNTKALLIRIKKYRKQIGLSQDYMAERLHITRTAYTKFENGTTNIDYDRLIKISAILGVPITELIDENQNLIFLFETTLPDNTEKSYQWAYKDFPKDVKNEWEAMEYIKKATGAINVDILSSSYNGDLPEDIEGIFPKFG